MTGKSFQNGWFRQKRTIAGVFLLLAVVVAGCGGLTADSSSSGSGVIVGGVGTGGTGVIKASLAGTAPDSCLVNAVVFVDKNGNRQLDDGEPNATTDANCGYTLALDPAEAGQYPVLALAIAGVTRDKASNQLVTSSYVIDVTGAGGN